MEPVPVFESNRDDQGDPGDESGDPPPKKVREGSIEIIDLDSENSAQPKSVETDLELGQSANEPLESSLTHALVSSALVSCADSAMTPTLDDSMQNAQPMQSQDSNNFDASPQPLHSDIAAVATDSPVQPTMGTFLFSTEEDKELPPNINDR